MINRILETKLLNNLKNQKVTILLGARRVGKTSLLLKLYEEYNGNKLWLNGEDADTKKIIENRSIANYKALLKESSLLIIDEAQHIINIGLAVKLMIDEIKPLHIIITGSSAFDLAQSGYPLVGRNITQYLFPIAQKELSKTENILLTTQNIESRLVYGSYPEQLFYETEQQKQVYLKELINTYLLKDILEFENIKNAAVLKKLLELIAYQVGNEVSENELANTLGISKNTVAKYLDLLEKVFVIFSLTGYSKNLRKEVSKSKKWYFFDNGIRNAIINNFSLIAIRQDVGQLWENYLIAERKKANTYNGNFAKSFFWRTYDKQEIDYVEELNDTLTAIEIKWKNTKVKIPIAFANAYPNSPFTLITKENYLAWIS
jgi:predicted AAA+ superfamily ATPase